MSSAASSSTTVADSLPAAPPAAAPGSPISRQKGKLPDGTEVASVELKGNPKTDSEPAPEKKPTNTGSPAAQGCCDKAKAALVSAIAWKVAACVALAAAFAIGTTAILTNYPTAANLVYGCFGAAGILALGYLTYLAIRSVCCNKNPQQGTTPAAAVQEAAVRV